MQKRSGGRPVADDDRSSSTARAQGQAETDLYTAGGCWRGRRIIVRCRMRRTSNRERARKARNTRHYKVDKALSTLPCLSLLNGIEVNHRQVPDDQGEPRY